MTKKIIKAIGIEILYKGMDRVGFQILYDNGQTKDYSLSYFDEVEQ